jgi:NAD(P)H-hydrate epimerase
MRRIEERLFAAGMPVAALMEKVAGRITAWFTSRFSWQDYPSVGVLAGPGHSGGDALVVARELWLLGYRVSICCPFERQKPLTAEHLRFVQSLGIPVSTGLESLLASDVWVDGWFGFGLERPLEGQIAELVDTINRQPQPVVSIDLPSGLHTDTGAVLGTAIQATHTLCLGLWKRAFCVDAALAYLGQRHLIDFDIPTSAITAEGDSVLSVRRITDQEALARLPLPRPAAIHKYQIGQLLLIAGSRQYAGAALLAGLGARASGVGMLTLAVPESLRLMLVAQLPEALVVGCDETEAGAIAHLPADLDLSRYDAIACGPGLSRSGMPVLQATLASPKPLVIDADGLNLLAELEPSVVLPSRKAATVITPHPGEFKRLFPGIHPTLQTAGEAAKQAANQSQSIVLLKGACTAIAHPRGPLWFNMDSTPALARGGSGDILTGLLSGLLAQTAAKSFDLSLDDALDTAIAATWWHAQAAKRTATTHTELGVDGPRLAANLSPTLAQFLAEEQGDKTWED